MRWHAVGAGTHTRGAGPRPAPAPQADGFLFNRGALLNAGALLLAGSSYDYFVFQVCVGRVGRVGGWGRGGGARLMGGCWLLPRAVRRAPCTTAGAASGAEHARRARRARAPCPCRTWTRYLWRAAVSSTATLEVPPVPRAAGCAGAPCRKWCSGTLGAAQCRRLSPARALPAGPAPLHLTPNWVHPKSTYDVSPAPPPPPLPPLQATAVPCACSMAWRRGTEPLLAGRASTAPVLPLAPPALQDFFGGLLIMTADQFRRVNGFGTHFWGWGREDDNLRERLVHAGVGRRRPGMCRGRGRRGF